MSGNREITQRIAAWDADEVVRRCLAVLFLFEFNQADAPSSRYTVEYEKQVADHSAQWSTKVDSDAHH